MTVIRGLVGAILFGAMGLLGWPAPASAQPNPLVPPSGFFAYDEEGLPPVKWSLSPTCVPSYCTMHVTSSTAQQVTHTEVQQNFGGVAQVVNGQWVLTVNKPTGIDCGDGTTGNSVDYYKFDQGITGGTHTITHAAVCGLQPAAVSKPFGLRFQGPLPIPIDPYPMHCTEIRFYCPN